MTTPAPTVVRTITADEIRDVTHYCHWIASRQGKRSAVMYRFADYTAYELLTALQAVRAVKRDSHFSGFAPRANLSHVNFFRDGTLDVVMNPSKRMRIRRKQSPVRTHTVVTRLDPKS